MKAKIWERFGRVGGSSHFAYPECSHEVRDKIGLGQARLNFGMPQCKKIYEKKALFVFYGKLNDKNCTFKFDTDSDVSIVNAGLVEDRNRCFSLGNIKLRYPSGEVVIKFRSLVRVKLEEFFIEMLMYATNVVEDCICILGVNFFSKTGIVKIFESFVQNFLFERNSCCRRISNVAKGVPQNLEEFYLRNYGTGNDCVSDRCFCRSAERISGYFLRTDSGWEV